MFIKCFCELIGAQQQSFKKNIITVFAEKLAETQKYRVKGDGGRTGTQALGVQRPVSVAFAGEACGRRVQTGRPSLAAALGLRSVAVC